MLNVFEIPLQYGCGASPENTHKNIPSIYLHTAELLMTLIRKYNATITYTMKITSVVSF